MASIIRIKRSEVSGNPNTLAAGELAYSALADNGSNGGDRLYIGIGAETGGNAANHIVIGGKYFTDMVSAATSDNTPGTLVRRDENGNINVGTITGTISGVAESADAWSTPIDLTLTGDASATFEDVDGSGNVSATLTLATVNSNVGEFGSATEIPVFTVNAKGLITAVSTASISTALGIAADSGSDTISLATDTLNFVGGTAIGTSINSATNTVTISAVDATTSTKGVASFDAGDFTVTNGAVSLNPAALRDIVGEMVESNTESGISVDYNDVSGKLNFNVGDFDLTLDGDVSGTATITDLGDATLTVTLDTVNSNVGEFGSATSIPVVTVNAKGLVTAVTTASIATTLGIAGNTGTDSVELISDTLSVLGSGAISTTVTDNTVTVSVAAATTSNLGVASFDATTFDVAAGAVSIKDNSIGSDQLQYSDVTIGTTTVALGATALELAGINQLDVDNIRIDSNTISSTNTNGNIVLNPDGTGTVNVSNARITGLAMPEDDSDAASKQYVDEVAQGLKSKPSVKAATTANLTATYDNGTAGVGATLTLAASAVLAIDGVTTWEVGNGILVKNQTNQFENGRYYVSQVGGVSTEWILTRCGLCDQASEIPAMYIFVQYGNLNEATGWVARVGVSAGSDPAVFEVGSDAIIFDQFSGAGHYVAGDGLTLNGTEFSVNLNSVGGLEIVADELGIKSSIAGDGLAFNNGVVTVIGTADRIAVDGDGVDIASTYAGQTSIVTLGTVTTGTWNATTIGVPYGGTGITTATARGIIYGNGTSAFGVTGASTADGSFLKEDATGNPYWSNVIDGGTY